MKSKKRRTMKPDNEPAPAVIVPPPKKFDKLQKLSKAQQIIAVVVLILIVALAYALVKHNSTTTTNPATGSTEALEDGSKQTESELRNFKHEATVLVTADGSSPETLTVSP